VILCRVIGNVVSSIQHPAYDGRTLLLCQPVNSDCQSPLSRAFIAVDSVQAGEGDLVVVAREGNAARQVLGTDDDPFHSVVLGIVDEVHIGTS